MSARGLCNQELAYARELLDAGDSPALRSAARLQLQSALRYFWLEIAASHDVIPTESFHNLGQLRTALQRKLGENHPVEELTQMEESALIEELLRRCDPARITFELSVSSRKKAKKNIIKSSQVIEIKEVTAEDFEKEVLNFLQRVISEWREYSQEY